MKIREWDSTQSNLSNMTYSPKERKLKKQVMAKATQAHRTTPPTNANAKKDFIKDKKVEWKEWNLREAVDFESELDNFVPCSANVVPNASAANDRPQRFSTTHQLDDPMKDALHHLKNVLNNATSSSNNAVAELDIADLSKNEGMDDGMNTLFIKYILERKTKDEERDEEITNLKNIVSKLQKQVEETKDDLDACQLIVSNHQRRIQDLQVLVDTQNVIIKDQANLLVDHMSSKEILNDIRNSMAGIRF